MPVAHKPTIAFSLVSIPISMYTATQDNDIHFNQLHDIDGQRIRYRKICGKCGQEVESKDIIKGYEYIEKERGVVSIVLGQYDDDKLVYKGHVTLGVSGHDFARIRALPRRERPPFPALPKGNESAKWVTPELVCTVNYMEPTSTGGMRQPVFKGLRDDKGPQECITNHTT